MGRLYWIAALCLFNPGLLGAAAILGDIKTEHFGYRPGDAKIAYFTANPGATIEVINAANGSVAYTLPAASIVPEGPDTSSPAISGDTLWWADFSPWSTPGTYHIYSASLNEQSYDFQISSAIYQAPLAAALKALYYARCGAPKTEASGGAWNDAACHAADAASNAVCAASADYPALNSNYGTLNLSGGWHDAGDYEKKIGVGTSCGTTETGDNGDTLWYLLSAYELNTGLLNGLSLNLPESGDGLPDVLNQAKWELDWYLKMQMPDYHVLEGVHVYNLGTLASPPSADGTQRGYNPPSFYSEAVFTACVAHAARVFAGVPAGQAYAATLSAAALDTWNAWVANSPNVDPNALSYLPYLPFKVWAASEIFRLSPGSSAGLAAQSVVDAYGNWTVYAASPAYANYAMINYLQTPGATAGTVAAMQAAMGGLVNALFSSNDLYNSGMPSYQYSWGSNQIKADTGLFLAWAADLNQTGSYSPAQCMAHAEDFLHYFHGDNPMNMVYMTNTDAMGAKHCVWQLYNSWFGQYTSASSLADYIGKPASVTDPLYPYVATDSANSALGPPPGYVPDGPTYQYFQEGGTDVPPDAAGPSQAPYAKSYRDYNRIFSGTSQPWIVNEAGIYQEGAYAMLAALFAGATVAPTATPSPASTSTASPTPTLSATPSLSPSLTATVSVCPSVSSSFSASPSFSVSPTVTGSATSTPLCTVTASPSSSPSTAPPLPGGPLAIEAAVPLPNPNPEFLELDMAGPATELEWTVYTEALVEAGHGSTGPLQAGWNGVPAKALFRGLPKGLYFIVAVAGRGNVKSSAVVMKAYLLGP